MVHYLKLHLLADTEAANFKVSSASIWIVGIAQEPPKYCRITTLKTPFKCQWLSYVNGVFTVQQDRGPWQYSQWECSQVVIHDGNQGTSQEGSSQEK